VSTTAEADAVNVASLPTPYYQDDAVTIYHGDWREVIPWVGKIDAVITDPPYGIGHKKGNSGRRGAYGSAVVRRNAEAIEGDKEAFDPSPWLDFPSVILWGSNHFAQSLPHGRWLAWNKLGDKEPWDSFSDVEFAWQNGRGKDRIFSHLWKGLCQAGQGEKRFHPTQKPVALMRWCLSLVPDAEAILDPFAGSCTTGVAAKLEGRKATLIELEERYCEIGANRLSQGVLF
jgi:site-specific DNA-methyltransferase (adenine-specific)/modification methylase